MLTPTPASVSQEQADRHVVWIQHVIGADYPGDTHWPQWLAACYRITPHLQRLGSDAALLDLGTCTDTEALSVAQAFLTDLQRQGITAFAAIGSSSVVAQLAFLHAPLGEPLALCSSEALSDLLRESPMTALTYLQFGDQAVITPKALALAVGKLEGYGVRSLAHLARLDEQSLHRQFGTRLGAILATIARAADPLPFQPTPAPLRLYVRLRMAAPLAADHLMGSLTSLTLEMASALARRGLQAQRLELDLRWETGAVERIERTVPQPLFGARVLEAVTRRMLVPVLQGNSTAETPRLVDGFCLAVSHLTPRYPAQDSFWPQRARRLSAVRELAETLAQRYGKPLLLQSRLTAPDAIFEQERSHLTPIQADVADMTAMLEEESPATAKPSATEKPNTIPHGIHWW